MTSHSSGVPRIVGVTASSNDAKFRETAENATDYSIFIGYGSKSKRIKDRWEATKRLLRFENNFAALKWLLDSFVDEYLRSKQITDTVTLTSDIIRPNEKELNSGRTTAARSPPKTRFEEVTERHEPSTRTPSKSPTIPMEQRPFDQQQKFASDTRNMVSNTKGYTQVTPGRYSYKYLQEYWPSYYHWPGGVPVNTRVVNVPPVPNYPSYMVKTSSCSALPIRDQRGGDNLKRWGSATAVKEEQPSTNDQQQNHLAAAVKLGLKTKSMPNLQFIPRDNGGVSEDEEEISDPESQGDLVALSSSSLSMPNLHKLPAEQNSLLSPPALRYEPIHRDRYDMCSSSSLSMPNLQTIQGRRPDERKKTIRDYFRDRLRHNDEVGEGSKTKIFNPNGYFMSTRVHDSDNKRVKQDIRRRLLQRIEAKKQNEETRKVPVTRVAGKRASLLPNEVKDHNGNSWKVPVSSVGNFFNSNCSGLPPESSRMVKGISWNVLQGRKMPCNSDSRIWNPADVHVKKEKLSDEESPPKTSVITSTANGGSPVLLKHTPPRSLETSEAEEKFENGDSREDDDEPAGSDYEDEGNVDVETYKENDRNVTDDSGESENELGDDLSPDGKRSKRMRKPDHPRKRLKATM